MTQDLNGLRPSPAREASGPSRFVSGRECRGCPASIVGPEWEVLQTE